MRTQAHAVSNPYYFLQHIKAGAVVEGPGRIVFTHNGRLCLHVYIKRCYSNITVLHYHLVDNGYHLYTHSMHGPSVAVLLDMLPGLVARQLSQA